MKKRLHTSIFGLMLMALVACEKADPELLYGDILGYVTVYDQDQYMLEDLSDVVVKLQSNTLQTETMTNLSGEFAFLNIDYGNYSIYPEKEGFVRSMGEDDPVHHLGGYSPTRISCSLNEIPRFGLEIDSAGIESGDISLWLSIIDWDGNPKHWYFFRCFFSGSPEVSKDAFDLHSQGWIFGQWILEGHYSAHLTNYALDNIDSDSIYLRIYPEALGQGIYAYNPESLGKASKVLAVKHPSQE
ncbi:MAG: carboxypeptidase regulatory-like domain-containing protein [Bacteroidia bacterium]|nr:MAG: carboxypeptidase regulatory-like domain-containing protein [Bacteroidia bacterium]